MSKLHKKFLITISISFSVIIGLSIFINNNVIERYAISQERSSLANITESIVSANSLTFENIASLEDEYGIVIIQVNYINDVDIVNENIRESLIEKGIVLSKYWLWEEDFEKLTQGKSVSRRYPQVDLKYSLLAEYRLLQNEIVLFAKIIPMSNDTLFAATLASSVILIISGIILLLVVSYFVHKIIKPIYSIRNVTKAIANSDYQKLTIKTNDEIELLAEDINKMSSALQKTHESLQEKNIQMKELLSNVSHELKTPVSLITLYSKGIKDNLDDGTFLETIIAQNNRIQEIITRLLEINKYDVKPITYAAINLSTLLLQEIESFRAAKVTFNTNIHSNLIITGNEEILLQIITNLLSNAVKYTENGEVTVSVFEKDDKVMFNVSNSISKSSDIDIIKIWDAFYVAEKSRNTNITGTGLGLALVKELCEKYTIEHNCKIEDNKITFSFTFVK